MLKCDTSKRGSVAGWQYRVTDVLKASVKVNIEPYSIYQCIDVLAGSDGRGIFMPSRPGNSRKYPETAYGKAVLFYRTQLEVTQEELALEVGLPKNRISAIESGETRRPRQDTIKTIVIGLKALGLDIELDTFEKKVEEYRKEIELAKKVPSYFASMQTTRCFTGRDDELLLIEKALWGGVYKITDVRAVVANGLGGVGKTTLVKEYAARNQKRYAGVCWLDTEHTDSLDDGLINLGASFNSTIRGLEDKKSAAGVVFNYLAESAEELKKPWLLIYDNIEEQSVLDLRKPRGGVHVLLTSRSKVWSADIQVVPVNSWDIDVATEYLMRASGRTDLDKDQVRELAFELGGLPLAVSHAAALLQRNIGDSPERFLLKLHKRLKQVPKNAEYSRHVYATFHEAIEVCDEEEHGARALLFLASVFGPDAIPFELYQQNPDQYDSELRKVLADEDAFHSIVGVLTRNSLIQLDSYHQHFSMHRIVQKVIQADWGKRKREWIDIGIKLILELCPGEGHENWSEFERYLLHMKTIIELASDVVSLDVATLSQKVGTYLYERGMYLDAEPYYQRALSIRTELLGEGHADVGSMLDKLGMLYDYQTRHPEAEVLYCRALGIREKEFGKDDVSVGDTLNNLALIYYQTDRYDQAEELFKRAKAIRIKGYGPDHPKVAQCLSNLARVYGFRDENSKAEEHFLEALEIRRNALGDNDPQVALVLHHLGRLYLNMDRFNEAEKCLKKALSIRESVLGADHPLVIYTLNFLGMIAEERGFFDEALSLHTRAVQIAGMCLPEGHRKREGAQARLDQCRLRIEKIAISG